MDNLTYIEFAERIKKNPVAIVPLGSYEQHGPSGNIGADYIVADYLAKKVSSILDIINIPCLPFGYSDIHSNFSGTISLEYDLYEKLIEMIINNLKRHGVKKIIFINGHGGNAMPLKKIIDMEEVCWIEWFGLTGTKFFDNDHKSHAGSEELSLLAHINEDFVSADLVQDMVPSKLGVDWRNLPPTERKTEYFTENGVFFKANKWNRNMGKEIEEYVIQKIVAIIDTFIAKE